MTHLKRLTLTWEIGDTPRLEIEELLFRAAEAEGQDA